VPRFKLKKEKRVSSADQSKIKTKHGKERKNRENVKGLRLKGKCDRCTRGQSELTDGEFVWKVAVGYRSSHLLDRFGVTEKSFEKK